MTQSPLKQWAKQTDGLAELLLSDKRAWTEFKLIVEGVERYNGFSRRVNQAYFTETSDFCWRNWTLTLLTARGILAHVEKVITEQKMARLRS